MTDKETKDIETTIESDEENPSKLGILVRYIIVLALVFIGCMALAFVVFWLLFM